MLFSIDAHAGLAAGSITRTFRTWKHAQARAGGRYRVAGMLLEVDAVSRVAAADLTEDDARAAGEPDLAALRRRLGDPDEQILVWRVDLHHVGPDDRIALRAADALSEQDIDRLRTRLDRLDAASATGPWTRDVLRLIVARPGVVSTELAEELGRERQAFKTDVRKLKNLGLTESLQVGYRISPRGEALLQALAD
jgi:biotin operon repressor